MKEFLEKISSYNLFNYLLPGVIFVVLCKYFNALDLVQKDLLLGVFFYYFVGLIISRIGSLIIEPILKKINFVIFTPSKDFISASAKDSKLEMLSEANNMYRTFSSLFILIGFIKLYEFLSSKWPIVNQWISEVLIGCFIILFMFSFRKQTQYIKRRVEKHLTKE